MQLEQLGYGVHLRKNNFEWKGGETQVQDMDAVYRQHSQTVFKYLMSDGAGMIRNTVSAEQEVLQQVGQMELLKKLHAFPEPGREVLYLRMFGNLSFREIGEVMGKTENWARVTFFRARTNLRKELEKDEK